MIRQIIRKELRINLLSLRFLIGLVVSIVLMGVVGYVLVEDYAARQQAYLSNVEIHRQALQDTKVYSELKVIVDIPPSPLSVFARGARDLPTSVQVSPFHIPSLLDEGGGNVTISLHGSGDRPSNPLLRVFNSIDLCFIISMILSLFAVLLVFDSFSGERESGTLKLLLSSSTGRARLLIGKFLGALLTLAIPLTIGFTEVLILWAIHPRLALEAPAWGSAALIYLASLAFLSSFLAFALLLSLYAKESSSSLMHLLLAWVVVTIVIPEGGEYVATFFRPSEIQEKMRTDTDRSASEFYRAYLNIPYQQKGGWNNASVNPMEGEALLGITEEEAYNRLEFTARVLPLKLRYAEDHFRMLEAFASDLRRWSHTRDNIIRPSLSVLYTGVVEAVAGTDVETFGEVVQNARLYRGAMMDFLEPKEKTPEWFTRVFDYPDVQPTDKNMRYWQELIEKQGERAVERILSWDRVKSLDLSTMPPPHIALPGALDRLSHAALNGSLLLGSVALFLILALWRMDRYPVT